MQTMLLGMWPLELRAAALHLARFTMAHIAFWGGYDVFRKNMVIG
jgi:hypothetical protein